MNSANYLNCPIPSPGDDSRITLAHGEGGRLMRELLRTRLLPSLGMDSSTADDAAWLTSEAAELAFTTDGYVVSPLFFPGGDIGKLAVFGTVNDLAVSGAIPRWLSLGLVIEEGLPWATLAAVLQSAAEAAGIAEVRIVTGDTKVVPRGAADQLFITTAGIGQRMATGSSSDGSPSRPTGPASLRPGDELLVTGSIARHGIAVMAARDAIGIDPVPTSDCALLTPAVAALLAAGVVPRTMRDATRGGVAAVLHEWAAASGVSMRLDQAHIPVDDSVAAVCELLGLDPLHVANEGTMVVAVAAQDCNAALSALRSTAVARGARQIGRVVERQMAAVVIDRGIGSPLPLDEPLGAPLPRIC